MSLKAFRRNIARIKTDSKKAGDLTTQMRAYDIEWIISTTRLPILVSQQIRAMEQNDLLALIGQINADGVPNCAGETLDWITSSDIWKGAQ